MNGDDSGGGGPPPPPPPPPAPPPAGDIKSAPLENGLDSSAPSSSSDLGGATANGAVGSGGQEIGPDGEPVKKWERPWSIAEMKQECQQWTLAADAGVGRMGMSVCVCVCVSEERGEEAYVCLCVRTCVCILRGHLVLFEREGKQKVETRRGEDRGGGGRERERERGERM